MVNIYKARCAHPGCEKIACFGFQSDGKKVNCVAHVGRGMVRLGVPRCTFGDCKTTPSFAVKGTRTPVRCAKHRGPDMENPRKKRPMKGRPFPPPLETNDSSSKILDLPAGKGDTQGMISEHQKRNERTRVYRSIHSGAQT